MASYWVSFAGTGDPNTKPYPRWQSDIDDVTLLISSQEIVSTHDLHGVQLNLLHMIAWFQQYLVRVIWVGLGALLSATTYLVLRRHRRTTLTSL